MPLFKRDIITLTKQWNEACVHRSMLYSLSLRYEADKHSVLRKDILEVIETYNSSIETYERLLDGLKPQHSTMSKSNSFPVKDIFSSPIRPGSKIKVLFLTASPTDQVRNYVEQELKAIQEQVDHNRSRFDLVPFGAIRPKDFLRRLLDENPYLLHFSGHGVDTGEICLQDEHDKTLVVPTEILANLFREMSKQIKCVILNACYSEKQAEAIAQHIAYVVGMHEAMGSEAARLFTQGFYQALTLGMEEDIDVEKAFRFGCLHIGMNAVAGGDIPVLYVNGQKR